MDGGICWYCYWGWAKPVADIYDKYEELLGESIMKYSHAHIVWEDENFQDCNIAFCLNECKKAGEENGKLADSLRELLAVPEYIRCCEPDDYEGVNPEKFPPPSSIQMVRR